MHFNIYTCFDSYIFFPGIYGAHFGLQILHNWDQNLIYENVHQNPVTLDRSQLNVSRQDGMQHFSVIKIKTMILEFLYMQKNDQFINLLPLSLLFGLLICGAITIPVLLLFYILKCNGVQIRGRGSNQQLMQIPTSPRDPVVNVPSKGKDAEAHCDCCWLLLS